MSLASDLLKQAERLARLEPKKPKQASLRRSVSAAYYSLFHLLIEDGARLITQNQRLRPHISRTFQHQEMKKIAVAIARPLPTTGHWLSPFFIFPLEIELITVCETFVSLQEFRHIADYDVAYLFNRTEVNSAVSRVLAAHQDWQAIRKTENASVFLLAAAGLLKNRP